MNGNLLPLSLERCAQLSLPTSTEALLLGMTMYWPYSSIFSFFLGSLLRFSGCCGRISFGYWNGVRSEKILCSIDGALLLWLVCRGVLSEKASDSIFRE